MLRAIHVAQLMGDKPQDYSPARMTYDQRRLRLHGVIERITGTHRYQMTSEGLRICLFLTKGHNRAIRPGLSQLNNGCPKAPNRPIASATHQLDQAMDQLIGEAKLAA